MDEMTSSEFRRRYATLTEPTVVTVLGRPIGVYHPVPVSSAVATLVAARAGHIADRDERRAAMAELIPEAQRQVFRPAPKPSRKVK